MYSTVKEYCASRRSAEILIFKEFDGSGVTLAE
jgi:hypothetical protein